MTQPKRYRFEPGPDGMQSHGRGLGRHVNHDPRSRRYPFRAPAVTEAPIFHQRHIQIFDQGELGSCTGNAALGILATGPYWAALSTTEQSQGLMEGGEVAIPWTEDGAVSLYSEFTAADDYEGTYPPDDTGSDGLTAAKVLTRLQAASGYQHTFSLADALAALQEFPLLVGTVWTDDMFYPDSLGRITPTGPVAGGHEWIVDEYVPAGHVPLGVPDGVPAKILSDHYASIGGTTSWGEGFGVHGRFYLRVADFGRLLAKDGDVIILTPPTAPAPTPEPDPAPDGDADRALAAAFRIWLADKGL